MSMGWKTKSLPILLTQPSKLTAGKDRSVLFGYQVRSLLSSQFIERFQRLKNSYAAIYHTFAAAKQSFHGMIEMFRLRHF